nr:MAG TPA: hypothetical protein [Crassvirales sp.]
MSFSASSLAFNSFRAVILSKVFLCKVYFCHCLLY